MKKRVMNRCPSPILSTSIATAAGLMYAARIEAIRVRMVSIVVSIQAIFLPFSPSRPPDKPRGLSMYSAILPDLRPKR